MKKCKKCGALQSDDRSVCLDCGTILGRPMSDEEADAAEEALDDRLEAMAERTEDFYVPLHDKIMGILCLAGVSADFVLMGLCRNTDADLQQALLCGIIGVISLIFAFPLLLFPRLVWNLSTLKYRMFYEWDTTPSDWALISRKVLSYVLFGVGVFATLWGWFLYL